MATRYFVQIAFADNEGMMITGPVTDGGRVDSGNKLYICKSLDPKEIGEMFLAFQADYKLRNNASTDVPF